MAAEGIVLKKLDQIQKDAQKQYDAFADKYQSMFSMNSALLQSMDKTNQSFTSSINDLLKTKSSSPQGDQNSSINIIRAINNSTSLIVGSIIGTKGGNIKSLRGLLNKDIKESINVLDTAYSKIASEIQKASVSKKPQTMSSGLGDFSKTVSDVARIPVRGVEEVGKQLANMSIGDNIVKFITSLNSPELKALFDSSPEYDQYQAKRQELTRAYITATPEERAKINQELSKLKEPSKETGFSIAKTIFSDVTEILLKFGSLKDFSVIAMAKLKVLGMIDISKPFTKFINNFAKSDLLKQFDSSDSYIKNQDKKLELMHSLSTLGKDDTRRYVIEKQLNKLDKVPMNKGDEIKATLDSVFGIISRMNSIKDFSLTSYIKFSLLSHLNFGKVISRFLRGFRDIDEKSADASIKVFEVLKGISEVRTLTMSILKSYVILKGISNLNFGKILGTLVKNLYFDGNQYVKESGASSEASRPIRNSDESDESWNQRLAIWESKEKSLGWARVIQGKVTTLYSIFNVVESLGTAVRKATFGIIKGAIGSILIGKSLVVIVNQFTKFLDKIDEFLIKNKTARAPKSKYLRNVFESYVSQEDIESGKDPIISGKLGFVAAILGFFTSLNYKQILWASVQLKIASYLNMGKSISRLIEGIIESLKNIEKIPKNIETKFKKFENFIERFLKTTEEIRKKSKELKE